MLTSLRRLVKRDNFVAGTALIVIAAVFLWTGRKYTVGTLSSMGPGFLPNTLCWILIACGLTIIVHSDAENPEAEERGRTRLLPLALIPLSYVVFAFTVENIGLLVSSTALVMLSAFALPDRNKVETAIVTVCLLLMATALWHVIGIRVPLLPGER